MGFFNRLKKRLFSLNIEEKTKKHSSKAGSTTQIDVDEIDFEEKNTKSDFKGARSVPSLDLDNETTKIDIFQGKQKDHDSLSAHEEKNRRKQRIKEGKINKYIAGLKKSGNSFSAQLKELQTRHIKIDSDYFNKLEEILIMSDISMNLVLEIIDEVKKEVKIENISDSKLINEIIADKLFITYTNHSHINTGLNIEDKRLNIILIVGVNGLGKTTSIAKLANNFKLDGKKVLIAAADTFRAGAVEQLAVWANRIGCEIVKSPKENGDPSSVVYDAVEKAKKENIDVLIIDTAGRLQNKVNLMAELEKMTKIIQKSVPNAPHETLLILDSTTGQNGVSQAIEFKKITPVTGIILTKMDGTSKGGIVLTIKEQTGLPVKLLGMGEKLDDLLEFDLDNFIYGLTKDLIDEN